MEDRFVKIQNILLERYADSNQEEIAALAGVSQPTVGRYLRRTHPEYIKAMRLDTFFKLFPDAEIVFNRPQATDYKEMISTLMDSLSPREQQRAYEVLKVMFDS